MENSAKNRLQSLQLAPPQIYRNIVIVPLLAPADGTFQYRTLGEALATQDLAITEVSEGGSVPELKVVNRGTTCVLLVDGEELAGAKQNRVLNTSILLEGASETKIPVSCTEQGRWAYSSRAFSDSGNVMAYKARSHKSRSVHSFLEAALGHKADQGEVWSGIADLQAMACAPSPTSAMSDVYQAREDDLRKGDEIFKPVANQVGFLAFINGAPAGAEMVSLAAAYAKLHAKLVRSYTLEALLVAPTPGEGGLDSKPQTPAADAITAQVRQFLDEIAAAEERPFPSVALGADHRFKGKGLAGTALVHEEEVIHAAFFRLEDRDKPNNMVSLRQRRRYFSRE